MDENKKSELKPQPVYQGKTPLVNTKGPIWGSIFAGVASALIVSFGAYMVTIKVNETKIEGMTKSIDRLQTSLDRIEKQQNENTITLNNNKNHIKSLEYGYVELKDVLRMDRTELINTLNENKTELNIALRNIKSRLNKLILALVSNPKIKLDYEKFTPFSALDGLDIDDLRKMAKEINTTQNIVNNKKISAYEKAVIVNKFFDGISDIYKTGKYKRAVISEKVFSVKMAGSDGSDGDGMGGGSDYEIE